MLEKQTIKSEFSNYIKLAQTGHYPLFFNEWVNTSLNLSNETHLNYSKASAMAKHTFNQLAKHKTIEKKKTALIGMSEPCRNEFIRSFFKIVEYEMLKDIKTLQ